MRGIAAGFTLDARFHWLRDGMEHTKEPTLRTVARLLAERDVPYALIGGLALQAHSREARTTLDIDLAIPDRRQIPSRDLEAAGFSLQGDFEHSQNWLSGDGTPVQFSDDPALAAAVVAAEEIPVSDFFVRVIRPVDLVHEKLRAARDPHRRRSKRIQDLADAQGLLEMRPELDSALDADERRQLAGIGI